MPARAAVKNPMRTGTRNNSESGDQTVPFNGGEPTTPISQAREALAALARGDITDNATTFANALAQTLYQYLEDRLVLSERNMDAAREVCTQAQIAESVVENLIDILTKCDYHRFAPVPLSSDERNSLITRADGVINDIENHQGAHAT